MQALRADNCEYLNAELGKIKGVKPPPTPDGYVQSWHLYKVRVYPEELGVADIHPKRFRWAVQKALQAEGVDCFEWHNMPVPAQKVFLNKEAYGKGCPWNCKHARESAKNIVYDPFDYPVCVDMFDRSFCIEPIYPPNGRELMEYIVEAFHNVFDALDEVVEFSKEIERLLDAVAEAKCIQVFGMGRMKCAVRAFVMRPMHMGLDAHVVYDTTCPNLGPGDLLIVNCACTTIGYTVMRFAKKLGAKVCAITAHPESKLNITAEQMAKRHTNLDGYMDFNEDWSGES